MSEWEIVSSSPKQQKVKRSIPHTLESRYIFQAPNETQKAKPVPRRKKKADRRPGINVIVSMPWKRQSARRKV